jgi:2-methylaconitate cis-trans-isomerase PrpF
MNMAPTLWKRDASEDGLFDFQIENTFTGAPIILKYGDPSSATGQSVFPHGKRLNHVPYPTRIFN